MHLKCIWLAAHTGETVAFTLKPHTHGGINNKAASEESSVLCTRGSQRSLDVTPQELSTLYCEMASHWPVSPRGMSVCAVPVLG